MHGSIKIQSTHLERQGVVYLRQSDPKQVRENRESAVNQRALKERLLELGWKASQVSILDGDQGTSARQMAGRETFQKLAADAGLGRIGIIMGYEVSRLARNCADWHRLLELCAVTDTLIGDVDGVYNPRDFNDRLLLGLKGTMSEAELHSLRLRLNSGRLSKARRGELVHHLPTGYVRLETGEVNIDPDEGVSTRIRLVFTKFKELKTGRRVLRYLVTNKLMLPRRQTSGLLDHSNRIRFPDGVEEAIKSSELTTLAKFKEGAFGDTSITAEGSEMFERVIFQCIIGSQAYGLVDDASDIDRRGFYLHLLTCTGRSTESLSNWNVMRRRNPTGRFRNSSFLH